MPLRILSLTIMTSALLLFSSAHAWADNALLEQKVKVAYMYQFTHFVNWPESKWGNEREPARVCVLGKDQFGNLLDSIEARTIKGRKVVVERLETAQQIGRCHLVYISTSEQQKLDAILGVIYKESVLTVSDIDDFATRGGIIGFVIRGNKIRLEINRKAADQAGLQISAKLLEIAKIVGEK